MPETRSEEDPRTASVELIRRYQAGDEHALGELFSRYYSRVYHIARVRCGARVLRSVDYDDVVQETFLTCTREFRSANPPEDARLVNWFARVVERRIVDVANADRAQRRDRDRERPLPENAASDASGAGELSDGATSVPARVARGELTELVTRAMQELREDHREVILLRDFACGSWAFVAEQMGCVSEGAARQLYARAREQLRRRMSPVA